MEGLALASAREVREVRERLEEVEVERETERRLKNWFKKGLEDLPELLPSPRPSLEVGEGRQPR